MRALTKGKQKTGQEELMVNKTAKIANKTNSVFQVFKTTYLLPPVLPFNKNLKLKKYVNTLFAYVYIFCATKIAPLA